MWEEQMVSAQQPDFRNQVLGKLGNNSLATLLPHLEHVDLKSRQDIEKPNASIKYVFFPESGIVSVVNRGPRKKSLEIGIIGREGMTGLTVVLGNDRSPHATFVQLQGDAYRIAADPLRTAMYRDAKLRNVLLHYVQAFMIQTAYTAIANGTARLEEKLARWLLMAHDRVDGDELPLIHDFLAMMLGVRRPGVTVALHSLEAQGLIDAKRSSITVLDRSGLEDLANASYGVPEAEYARLMSGR
jgi:CRP-like cAMP-binding protein